MAELCEGARRGRQAAEPARRAVSALHDMGLSTVIGLEGTDASGNALKASMKISWSVCGLGVRRSKVHSADRNLRQAFSQLDRLAEKINVGGPVDKGRVHLSKGDGEETDPGKIISSMITASLYAALRDTETPRTLKDLASASGVKKNDLAQSVLVHPEGDGPEDARKESRKRTFRESAARLERARGLRGGRLRSCVRLRRLAALQVETTRWQFVW